VALTWQVRTLVLTSHALYRVAFAVAKGTIDHYSRTSLGSLMRIERGRYAFKLLLTEPDGRENPFAYFWTAYVKKGQGDQRFERVYYPIHLEVLPPRLHYPHACITPTPALPPRLHRPLSCMALTPRMLSSWSPTTNPGPC
jgi:hypothetical protein